MFVCWYMSLSCFVYCRYWVSYLSALSIDTIVPLDLDTHVVKWNCYKKNLPQMFLLLKRSTIIHVVAMYEAFSVTKSLQTAPVLFEVFSSCLPVVVNYTCCYLVEALPLLSAGCLSHRQQKDWTSGISELPCELKLSVHTGKSAHGSLLLGFYVKFSLS